MAIIKNEVEHHDIPLYNSMQKPCRRGNSGSKTEDAGTLEDVSATKRPIRLRSFSIKVEPGQKQSQFYQKGSSSLEVPDDLLRERNRSQLLKNHPQIRQLPTPFFLADHLIQQRPTLLYCTSQQQQIVCNSNNFGQQQQSVLGCHHRSASIAQVEQQQSSTIIPWEFEEGPELKGCQETTTCGFECNESNPCQMDSKDSKTILDGGEFGPVFFMTTLTLSGILIPTIRRYANFPVLFQALFYVVMLLSLGVIYLSSYLTSIYY